MADTPIGRGHGEGIAASSGIDPEACGLAGAIHIGKPGGRGVTLVNTEGDRRREGRAEYAVRGRGNPPPDAGFPLFPPGPGLGGAGVVDDIRKLLKRDPGVAWRRYQAELANTLRWKEILEVRPDLAPAIDGKLNPNFTEWLMGWEVGWTDLGEDCRIDRLRVCGNGVVPYQAALAWRVLSEALS